MVKNSKTNKNNNNSNLCWNTLALLLVFSISIGIGYLMYSIQTKNNSKNNNKNNSKNNSKNNNKNNNKNKNNLTQEDVENKVEEVKNLIINSDKVIKELEKFSDLQKIEFPDEFESNNDFELKDDKVSHREYKAYFLDNDIGCIKNAIVSKADSNEMASQRNKIEYNQQLKEYIEAINLDLIQFLQKSYKDAHKMNVERQLDLQDIDNLPGKFM